MSSSLIPADLHALTRQVVQSTPVSDIHTHLYDPGFGPALCLWGIDELLTYHYLVSEAFRRMDVSFDAFWSAPKAQQADWIWKSLFVDGSPVSEACRGVITVLQALDIDPRAGDLPSLRRWFAGQDPARHLDHVLGKAGVGEIHMTNSPFDPVEVPRWETGWNRDPRFVAALRIDPLLLDWPTTVAHLRDQGYAVTVDRSQATADGIRRFLKDWTRRIQARYCMVSLPPSFQFPDASDTTWILQHAVLPHCREHDQALALMLGVQRAVNPALRLAGDGVGRSQLSALQHLCAGFPRNKFLATCLSRENQHELVVLARKFRNLHPFGCWWFTNTPQLVDEITRMRLELLGTSFTPQHSDARVVEQLLYKWGHSRDVIAGCLGDRYSALSDSGWTPTETEIRRDVRALLGGAFRDFLSRSL
jgi:hypothetical protein